MSAKHKLYAKTNCRRYTLHISVSMPVVPFLLHIDHVSQLQVVLHEVYDTPNTLYMVMEYAQNGDLLEYVNHQGSLLEVDTRRVMHQLLDVVSYLHDNLVYHRDIKLENILLDQFYNIRLSGTCLQPYVWQ